MSSLLILGAGGHGRVVADAALASGAWARVFASDRDPARTNGELLPGVALLPMALALAEECVVHVAIGNAMDRERECAAFDEALLAAVVHPSASISTFATVGTGCFVAAQSVIAPRAVLGRGVIVNHGAVVDHDVQVGDFTHVAPRAALGGGVMVGRRVLVGAGVSVLPGIRIADDVVVGAGAVVTGHLEQPGVYAGVPARRLK